MCAHNKESVVFFGGGVTPSLLNIKGLYPILWLSQKSKTNENIPASDPSSREEKVRSSVTETGMKGGKEGGGHLNTGLNTAVKKKGDAEERRWVKGEWISQGDFSLGLNWVYVFTQPANNSVQGGMALLYTHQANH